MIWGSAVVIAATYIGLRAWGRRARAAHDLAVDDGFSFGDAVDRMHERERATALANAERREAYARTR